MLLLTLVLHLLRCAVPGDCLQQLQQLADVLMQQCPKLAPAPVIAPAEAPQGTATNHSNSSEHSGGSKHDNILRLWPTWSPAPQHTHNSKSATATRDLVDLQQEQLVQDKHDQQLQLHMSLSRTVPIKHIQIASLKAAVSKQLKPFKRFKVELQGLTCLVNDAGTRSFVCLKVSKGLQQVRTLLVKSSLCNSRII